MYDYLLFHQLIDVQKESHNIWHQLLLGKTCIQLLGRADTAI